MLLALTVLANCNVAETPGNSEGTTAARMANFTDPSPQRFLTSHWVGTASPSRTISA